MDASHALSARTARSIVVRPRPHPAPAGAHSQSPLRYPLVRTPFIYGSHTRDGAPLFNDNCKMHFAVCSPDGQA